MSAAPERGLVEVRDPVVRLGHRVMVLACFVARFSSEDESQLHVYAGYVVAAVVLLRIVWGFVGSRHARFADFVRRPGAVFSYVSSLFTRSPQHFLGRHLAGGVMILLLLGNLAATTWTGLELNAVEENAGPLAGPGAGIPVRVAPLVRDAVAGDEATNEHPVCGGEREAAGDETNEEYWEGLHEFSPR